MDETLALKKRCCGPEGCGEVPRPSLAEGRHCIGSRCMAWTPYEDSEFQMYADAEYKRTGRRRETTLGFCGLTAKATGKP